MKRMLHRLVYSKWFHLFVNAALFVILAWLLPIHFETNDDVAMCMIASGKYTGTPDGHIVYANALFGWLIAGLYSLTKAVEWYTLVLCVAQVVAMTGITYAMVTETRMKNILKIVFVLFLYVFWARLIMALQFTTTAGLLCASGCMSLLRLNRKWRIAGLCMVVVASFIRFNASAMVGLLFAPMFLAAWVRDKKYAFWLGAVLLLVMVGVVGDKLCYRTQDWKEYKEYDALRGYINDNPNANLAESELPEGVSMEDYQMLKWFNADPTVLTTEKLRAIKAHIKQGITPKSAVSNLAQLSGYGTTLAMLLAGYVILFMAMLLQWKTKVHEEPKNKWYSIINLAQPVLVFLIFFAFVLYFGMTELLKPRAFLCMLLPVFMQMLLLFPKDDYRYSKLLLGVMTGLVLVMSLKYVKQVDKVNRLYHANQERFDDYIYPLMKDRTDVICGCPLECLRPFKVNDVKFRTIGMGWMTKIPFNKGRLDSHLDFVDSDYLYLSGVDNPPYGITNSIERNYGIKVRLDAIEENEEYALFLIRSMK